MGFTGRRYAGPIEVMYMRRKLTALLLAAVAVLVLAGCSGSKSAPGSDPELEQLSQEQQADEKQIDDLIQQIDQSLN